MKKILLAFVTSGAVISGCTTAEVNIFNRADDFKQVQAAAITYIIPNEYVKEKHGLKGIEFTGFDKGPSTKQEKLFAKPINDNSFMVHRRTDNGTTGSGVIYNVRYSSTVKGNNTVIKAQPFQTKRYQQGFIAKFTVPPFNIRTFLLTSRLTITFELDATAPPDTVKSSFDLVLPKKPVTAAEIKARVLARIAGKEVTFLERYVLEVDGNTVWLSVDASSYKEGSKITITASLNTNASMDNGNTVNLSDLIKQTKISVAEIVESANNLNNQPS